MPLRRLLLSVALALLTLLLSGTLLLGAAQRGIVKPPEGLLWLGPVALSGHRDCITQQWNMPCAAGRPWTLRLVVRRAPGGWRLIRLLRIEPASTGAPK